MTVEVNDGSPPAVVNGSVDGADSDLSAHMARFDTVRQQLDSIAHNTSQVQEITKRLRVTASETVRKQIIADKDAAILSTTQNGQAVKRTLDALRQENEGLLAASPDARNTARMDMRINLYNTYLRKFDHVITDSNTAIVGFKSVLEQIEKRQIKVVLPELTDEKVQELIDSGTTAQVVQQALVSDNLQDTVRMIEERHDEILKLERQVREIFELFNDLAQLVNLQGDSLDVISVNISHAQRTVEKTETVIDEAHAYMVQARNVRPQQHCRQQQRQGTDTAHCLLTLSVVCVCCVPDVAKNLLLSFAGGHCGCRCGFAHGADLHQLRQACALLILLLTCCTVPLSLLLSIA